MNIDELIKESIDDATGPTPTPDLDRIHRHGRRRSTVRVGAAALATIGVVAAGTYAVQGIDDVNGSDELPASVRTQGPALAFVTYNPTRAHIDGKAVEPDHKGGLEASALTTAGLVYISGDSNGTPYFKDRSGAEMRLGDPVNPDGAKSWGSEVVADSDRSSAVWSADVAGPEVQLNRFDADAQKVADSVTFDPADVSGMSGTSLIWPSMYYDGVVYADVEAGRFDQTFAWDPSLPEGQQVYAATDPDTVIAAVGNDRLVLKGKGNAYGGPEQQPLDPSTRVTRLPGTLYGGVGVDSSRLSPDGTWALVDPDQANDSGYPVDGPDADTFNDPSDDYAAMNLDTGKQFPLHSQGIVEARFDDDGSVLIIEVTPDGGDRLIDCALPSDECATVLDDVPNGGPEWEDDSPVAGFLD
ncbi:hypothetical protein [Solicola gregarius]|uniref:Uncharacterized protein n=1 Tax=Solicola gregarius TaxID=2908642 RepID=A0AA46YNK5_9ACTN|nr:hypothetical protein [Solicola gregarius]UYM06778.1 hypothetical protein L0C25_06810 [Solicola gregarius]